MPINSNKYVNTDSQDTPIIRYIEAPVAITQYGVDITDVLGGVDSDGNLKSPNGGHTLDLSSITGRVTTAKLMGKFYLSEVRGDVVLNATEVGDFGCHWGFRQSKITGFECPRLSVCGYGAFQYAFTDAKVKVAKFDNIVEISNGDVFNSAFMRATVESASFANLETISGYGAFISAFVNTKITENPFPKLKTITGGSALLGVFGACKQIETFSFNALETVTGNSALNSAFTGCTKLTTLSFPALKTVGNQGIFTDMLSNCSDVTVHFPSNLESTMSSWTSVTNGFGGTNTTVLFDLPSTGS